LNVADSAVITTTGEILVQFRQGSEMR